MEIALTVCLMTSLFLSANFGPSLCQTPTPTFDRGSCPPLQLSNLGSVSQFTSTITINDGLLPSALQIGTPEVSAFDFHVVCEVAGRTRGTVSAVSFVVDYECSGDDCSESPLDTPAVNLTEQFQFNCTLEFLEAGAFVGNDNYDTLNGVVRTQNPLAGFDTPLNDHCGLCVDPAAGLVEADPVTHCIRKY